MSGNIWISSSSESDDSLPSFSNFLSQKSGRNAVRKVNGFEISVENVRQDEKTNFCYGTSEKESKNKKVLVPLLDKTIKTSSDANSKCNDDIESVAATSLSKKTLSFKPEELYKNLTCYVSASVIKLFKAKDVISNVQATLPVVCKVIDENEPVVTWKLASCIYGQLHEKEHFSNLNQALFVIAAENLINLIQNFKSNNFNPTFSKWLHLSSASQSTPHIACYGLKKYKQLLKTSQQRKYKQTVLDTGSKMQSKENSEKISLDDIPDLFTDIQLKYGIDILFIENETEFVLLLSQITKAIAEAPMKRSQRKDVLFVSGPSSVKIDANSGSGCRKAWRMMLEQLFNVSSDISSSITSCYPTLSSLMQAYQSVSNEEGLTLLSDIVVRRGFGSLQRSRQIGPELSKRIFKLLQTEDKEEVI